MDILMTMPIADRRYYIMMHNKTDNGGSSENDSQVKNEDSEKIQMLSSVKDWH